MNSIGFSEILLVLIFITVLVPGVFFMLTLQNTLKAVKPENRTMKPGKIWLLFIPLFNYVWMFVVVKAIASSLKSEFENYGIFSNDKPTYNVGLALSISSACSLIPIVGVVVGIPVFVLWITYWIQVNDKKKELLSLQNTYGKAEEGSIFATAS